MSATTPMKQASMPSRSSGQRSTCRAVPSSSRWWRTARSCTPWGESCPMGNSRGKRWQMDGRRKYEINRTLHWLLESLIKDTIKDTFYISWGNHQFRRLIPPPSEKLCNLPAPSRCNPMDFPQCCSFASLVHGHVVSNWTSFWEDHIHKLIAVIVLHVAALIFKPVNWCKHWDYLVLQICISLIFSVNYIFICCNLFGFVQGGF